MSKKSFRKLVFMYKIKSALSLVRRKENVSQFQLAKRVGGFQTAIARLESDKVEPRFSYVAELLWQLGYDVNFKITKRKGL